MKKKKLELAEQMCPQLPRLDKTRTRQDKDKARLDKDKDKIRQGQDR